MDFLSAGISGIFASTLMYPIDVLKAQAQLNDELSREKSGKIELIGRVWRRHGLLGFYRGIKFVWMRQVLSSPIRYGGFSYLDARWNRERSPWKKFAIASSLAGTSAVLTTPVDLALIKRQATLSCLRDQLPLIKLQKKHFVTNVMKNVSVTCPNMLIYSSLSAWSPMVQAAIPALCGGAIGYPLDLVRSRVFRDFERKYCGAWDCLVKTVRHEGARNLYHGYSVFAMRDVPQTFVVLLAFTWLRRLFAGEAI
ncbi:MAG: MC/SLC25 family protein [Sulfobacillus sp.]